MIKENKIKKDASTIEIQLAKVIEKCEKKFEENKRGWDGLEELLLQNKKRMNNIRKVNNLFREFINREGKLLVLRKKRIEKSKVNLNPEKQIDVIGKEIENGKKMEKYYEKEIERLGEIEMRVKEIE